MCTALLPDHLPSFVPRLHDGNMQLEGVCCHLVTVAQASAECLNELLPFEFEVTCQYSLTCKDGGTNQRANASSSLGHQNSKRIPSRLCRPLLTYISRQTQMQKTDRKHY